MSTRDEVLAEFVELAEQTLALRVKNVQKIEILRDWVGALLDPGAVSAVDVVGARMTMTRITYESGTVCLDGNGDLAGVKFDVPAEVEWRETQS